MIRSRPIAYAILALAFACVPALAAQHVTLAELEQAFRDMTPKQRRAVQQAMSEKGYYHGRIDGAWRPSVAGGYKTLMASPEYQDAASGWIGADEDVIQETLFFGADGEE